MALAGLTLGACSSLDAWVFGDHPDPDSRPIAVEPLEPGAAYPRVASVPARPRLSYTVQQEREIVDALISDRENARYTGDVIRYRSGVSGTPPRPPEAGQLRGEQVVGPHVDPALAPPPARPPLQERASYAGARGLTSDAAELDDGGLDDFVRGLVDETEAEPDLGTQTAIISRRVEGAPVPGRKGEESAFERLFFWIGEQFSGGHGDGEEPAAPVPPDKPPATDQPDDPEAPESGPPKLKPDESADPPEPAPAKPGQAEQAGRTGPAGPGSA